MKTKFNYKDVPDWCRWIAVDEDGACFAYEKKPVKVKGDYGGYWNGDGITDGDQLHLYKGEPPKNWKDELYTWGYE